MAADAQGGDSLAERLEDARLELQRLQDLVAEVPELMEIRFRQELRQVAELNQALMAERQQLMARLEQPAGPLTLAAPPVDLVRRLRWPAAVLLVTAAAAAAVGFWSARSPITLAAALGRRPPLNVPKRALGAPRPLSTTSQSLVDLLSSGTTWVEVVDSGGELLLRDTLNRGDTRRIRLRSGLTVLAGQPQLLRYRVDEGPWQRWPQASLRQGSISLLPSP